jgi:hypothetical protein
MDWKLELVIVPVSDVDRAKAFYERVGFNADHDHNGDPDLRSGSSLLPARPARSRSAWVSPTRRSARPACKSLYRMSRTRAQNSSSEASRQATSSASTGAPSSSSATRTATAGRCRNCSHPANRRRARRDRPRAREACEPLCGRAARALCSCPGRGRRGWRALLDELEQGVRGSGLATRSSSTGTLNDAASSAGARSAAVSSSDSR